MEAPMPQAVVPAHKIRKLLHQSVADDFNKTQTANRLKISRTSATKYVNAFKHSALTCADLQHTANANLSALLFPNAKWRTPSDKKSSLLDRFASIHSKIEHDDHSLLDEWRAEVGSNHTNYKYSQ